jgi:hypothetical protein
MNEVVLECCGKSESECICIEDIKTQNIFKEWEHYIGQSNINGEIITPHKLKVWAENKNRGYVCIFCGSIKPYNSIDAGFLYCRRCNEYKGIIPDC